MDTQDKRGWWPENMADERMPEPKADPLEWLAIENGKIIFGRLKDEDGGFDFPGEVVQLGQVLTFDHCDYLGTRDVAFAADGTFVVQGEPPADYTQCWDVSDSGFCGDTLDEMGRYFRDSFLTAEDAGEHTIGFVHWGQTQLKLVEAAGRLALISPDTRTPWEIEMLQAGAREERERCLARIDAAARRSDLPEAERPVVERTVAEISGLVIAAGLATEAALPPAADSFQARVDVWMEACFGTAISADKLERGDRLLEEVLEMLQSEGYPLQRVASLTSYVWSRVPGYPPQEVGGVKVTLAAFCSAHGINMHAAGEAELARIWTKIEAIRAKQAAKPTGSALPQAWSVAAKDWRPTHRHVKRGSTYRLIGEAEAQVSSPSYEVFTSSPYRPLREGDRLAVYEAEDGKLWVQLADEFGDGRFEALPTSEEA